MLYDTHCHPNLAKDKDSSEIINGYFKENTEGYMNIIGTDLETSKEALKISKKFDRVFCSVGIHPTDSVKYRDNFEEVINYLEELYLNNKEKIVAIGECGLDYHWLSSLSDEYSLSEEEIIGIQKDFFIAQINLAKKLGLPIIIHNRNTKDDILEILIKLNFKHFIFHCYCENLEYAERLIKFSPKCKISFSGIVTFKNAKEIQETAQSIPLENILIETDSPYLTPSPYRGKEENEPLFVKYVLAKIIELRTENPEEIKNQLLKNSLGIFGVKKYTTFQ